MEQRELEKLKKECPAIYQAIEEAAEENNQNLSEMSKTEVFDLWLQWEGIIGYARQILSLVKGLGLGDGRNS